MDGAAAIQSTETVDVHVTAAEAYPALEAAFLTAQTEIWASFLVFDLQTHLRSDEGRAVGQTWFDLVVYVLRRGVALNFVISDADPIGRPQMHKDAMRSMRLFCAAAECAGEMADLKICVARHPGQVGMGIRALLWPYIMKKLKGQTDKLNALTQVQRVAALRDLPGIARHLRTRPDGRLTPRVLSLPALFPVVHHQKMAVIDRKTLFIGGLDLNERRYDTPQHRQIGSQTWHDVQLTIAGPVVSEAQHHLESFQSVVAGTAEPDQKRHLLTTLSRRRTHHPFSFGPQRVDHSINATHTSLTNQATRLIYLESQYFRDHRFAKTLARRAMAEPKLTLILILPAAPDDVAFEGNRGLDARFGEFAQSRALRILRRAFGTRLLVASPAQRRSARPADRGDDAPDDRDLLLGAPLIYVHSKVSIFDDHAAVVSSANLNPRSFFWDTEAGVHLTSTKHVDTLRKRAMAVWLPQSIGPEAYALSTAVKEWRRIAFSNARLRPENRKGLLLPHDFAAAEAFGTALPFVPDELV